MACLALALQTRFYEGILQLVKGYEKVFVK